MLEKSNSFFLSYTWKHTREIEKPKNVCNDVKLGIQKLQKTVRVNFGVYILAKGLADLWGTALQTCTTESLKVLKGHSDNSLQDFFAHI